MDPIGLVGTLIAIVELSTKLISVCYEYRAGVKGARQEISQVLEEIIAVRTLCERLIDIAAQSDDEALPSLKAIDGPHAPLRRCLEDLEDLKSSLKLKDGSQPRSVALLWPLKQKEVERKLVALGRIKATLQLGLGADTAQNTVKILANTSSIPLMQKRLSGLADTLERTAEAEQKQNLLAKLRARNVVSKHQEQSSKRINGTGDWIISHKTYEEWLHTNHSLLWLSGGPGSGKTVLCSHVVDDLQRRCILERDAAVVYFYIDGSDRQPLLIDTFYSSFVHQLALQTPGVPPALEWQLRSYQADDTRHGETLKNLYRDLLKSFSRAYIVIDALDECQEFIDLDDIVQLLMELQDGTMQTTKIIASSRSLEQLRHSFEDIGALHIPLQDDAVYADIKMVLHNQLSGSAPFKRWPPSLRDSVTTTLLSRADGSFHWVMCQLAALKRCMTPATVRERLQNLPQTLESHYLCELDRLQSHNGQSVRNVLRWVAFSLRPLSIAELAEAIAINVEDQDEPFLDAHLELFDMEAFLDSCSSLLTTYRDVEYLDHDHTVFVKFTHFSVLEFLRSDALQKLDQGKFAMEDDLIHSNIAKSCLIYIHQFADDAADDVNELPALLRYTASSWLRHKVLSSDDNWASSSAKELLQAIFQAESKSFTCWLKYSSIDKPWEYSDSTIQGWNVAMQSLRQRKADPTKRPTPIYCATIGGLDDVVKKLLDSGADPNVKYGIHAYSLQAAAAYGYTNIVKQLIDAGADVNATGGKSGTAITAAAHAGHTAIVRILLEAGAECQPRLRRFGDRKDDPLFMAASKGHLDVVNLLLDHGAEDWHEMKGRPCTALSAAVNTGKLDIVRSMLSHERIRTVNEHVVRGIIRSQSSGLNQGLYNAAAHGKKDILRELAKELTDAEVLRYAARAGDETLFSNAMAKSMTVDEIGQYSDHPRALQSACLGGHLTIVKKLLAAGADPNLVSDYSTALEASVHGGNLDIARVLIEAGANMENNRGRSMGIAMSLGRRDFMEFFVAHGADTYPCLLSAVRSGEYRDFTVLLELGADIHHHGPDSDISLLQAAAFGSSVSIIRYLLDHGWNVEHATQTHPLTEAIRCRHIAAAKYLLDRGANFNAQPTSHNDPGKWGGSVVHGNCWPPKAACDTPLSAAVKIKSRDLIASLLDLGAIVRSELPESCGTPLLFAVWEEEFDVVRMLLEKGAPPDQPGIILQRKKSSYPLHLAAEKGNVQMITLLIDAGATVDQQDIEGFSAAHIAAASSNSECLRTLVHDHKADLALRLQNGSLPIHSAAARGDTERVQILLDAGSYINHQNDSGRTPLHWAADAENCEVVIYLLDRGADATITADDGTVTAWDLMCLAVDKPYHAKGIKYNEVEERKTRAAEVREVLREAMYSQQSILGSEIAT